MKTLDRYLLSKVASRFALLLLIFVGILLGAMSAMFIGRGVPPDVLVQILPTFALIALPLALPLAVATALLVTIGAMNRAGELQALASTGVDPTRVILRLWPMVVSAALAFAVLLHLLLPLALGDYRSLLPRLLEAAIARKSANLEAIFDSKGVSAWAGQVQGRQLGDVYLRQISQGHDLAIYAPRASWSPTTAGPEFRLDEVKVISRNPDGRLMAGDAQSWAVVPISDRIATREPETLSTPEVLAVLADPASRKPHDDSIYNNARLTLHLRFFLPLALVAYALFAVGLARVFATAETLPAVAIIVAVVTLATYPAFGYVKSDADAVQISPGWLLWPIGTGIAVVGWLMLVRPLLVRDLVTTPPWRWRKRR